MLDLVCQPGFMCFALWLLRVAEAGAGYLQGYCWYTLELVCQPMIQKGKRCWSWLPLRLGLVDAGAGKLAPHARLQTKTAFFE